MEIKENQVLKIIFVPVSKEKTNIYAETCGKCCLNDDGEHPLSVLCHAINGGPMCCTQRCDKLNGYFIASLQVVAR
jgi:hypothetical protein